MRCQECGREVHELLFHCHRCGKKLCKDHHLPENHTCLLKPHKAKSTVRVKSKDDGFKVSKVYYELRFFVRKYIIPWNLINWLKYSRKNTTTNLLYSIAYLLLALIIYSNFDKVNAYKIPVFKLGSVLLLAISLLFLRSFWKFNKSLNYKLQKKLSNNIKLVLTIVFVYLLYLVYTEPDKYFPDLEKLDFKVDMEKFNPLQTNLTTINATLSKWMEEYPENMNKDTYNIELLLYRETNQIRREKGLGELNWDPLLADVAREHSLDMAGAGYFSHDNLQGEDPTDRANKRGYSTIKWEGNVYWIGVGENIGMMPTGDVIGHGHISTNQDVANAMMQGWMNSPGHRQNILNNHYQFIGVGVAKDTKGQYYLTQDFK